MSACEKKADPTAYRQDLILSDLTSKLDAAGKAVDATQKELDGFKKELSEVKPQTGQIKFALKRVYDTDLKLRLLKQEKRYLEVSMSSREKLSKKLYMESFKAGTTWPDHKGFEEYKTEERLRHAKRSWDVKQRLRDAGIEIPGEAPIKKPAESAPAGGH